MGLVSKTAKVKWVGKNKKHYEELGYKYTKMGDEFEVKVEDLPKGSSVKVDCICDNCKCNMHITYDNYNKKVKARFRLLLSIFMFNIFINFFNLYSSIYCIFKHIS